MAADATLPRYCFISVMWRVLVWRHGRRWVVQWKRGEVNAMRVCENGNLMRREGVTNELHLKFYCIYTKDNVNLSNLRPSFFRSLSKGNTFSPSQPFPSFQRDVSLTGWQHSAANPESHVCVCEGNPCVYISSSTFSTCFVLSGKCFANGMTTLWSMLLTWATVCCMLKGRKPYKHIHSGSWGENKGLQWHFKQMVTFQLRYMSFLLTVEQDI